MSIKSETFTTAKKSGVLGLGKKIIESRPVHNKWTLYDYRTDFRPLLIIVNNVDLQQQCPKNWVVG